MLMTQINLDNFRPIFVVGNSRSGTTLMARILGRHPAVFTLEELHFFEELWSPNYDYTNFNRKDALQLASRLLNIQRNGYLTQKNPPEFLQEAEKIIGNLPEELSPPLIFSDVLNYETHLHHKTIPCEHTPRNVLYIGEILNFYPQARIIKIIRDPRDVLLSQKRRWKRPFLSQKIPKKQGIRYWVNYHAITISKLWNANVRTADRFEGDPRVYSLRFEDLIREPESTVEKICSFLGISYDDQMLEVPRIGSSSERDQPEQTGISQDRVERWRQGGLTATEIFICQKINQDLMEKHGYKLETIVPNPLLLILSITSFPVKLILALLFSLKRIGNITETIRRRLG
jgi:omega-hydroxy-beta-dihydromenaquinone-9 sulfotransferase